MNIADTTLGKTTNGIEDDAKNQADGLVVSLGDGGEAIYYFQNPIIDGNGFDFAVFENGFLNPIDSNLAYLELATVSVSNDGISYYQFKDESHTDTTIQIAGTGEYMDCRKVYNLAGKYITSYGTPFDLSELAFILGLDLNNIHFIKIKDVIGNINKLYCTYDNNLRIINDPYPTDFSTGGFDLDAIAILHQVFPNGLLVQKENPIVLYPNPTNDRLFIQSVNTFKSYTIYSILGKLILKGEFESNNNNIDVSNLAKGQYILHLNTTEGKMTQQLFSAW
jgi:hypothetical protein